jgi:hypothetical protein
MVRAELSSNSFPRTKCCPSMDNVFLSTDNCSVSHQWHRYLQAWRLTGDVYSTKPGSKPWISEMYGYSFAAAKHNMWHRIDPSSMLYPGYLPSTPPRLLHYGLEFTVSLRDSGKYSFDKHWHFDFDPFACAVTPSGDERGPRGSQHPPDGDVSDEGGLFPLTPDIDRLESPPVCSCHRQYEVLCLYVRVIAPLSARLIEEDPCKLT